MKIKKGDTVQVIAGKDKGAKGKVIQAYPETGKVLRRTSKLKAHDEQNECGIGDRVLVMETRPLSATKRWRVVQILEKAK
jgi:ribosomal protein S17